MTSGFKEIKHTADWALEVWAPDFCGLLNQAALGMNWLMGVELVKAERIDQTIIITAADFETLLVSFLNEILFRMETESIGFNEFDIHLNDFTLEAQLQGARLQGMKIAIKAVTYHNLEIRRTRNGLETTIVFDV